MRELVAASAAEGLFHAFLGLVLGFVSGGAKGLGEGVEGAFESREERLAAFRDGLRRGELLNAQALREVAARGKEDHQVSAVSALRENTKHGRGVVTRAKPIAWLLVG